MKKIIPGILFFTAIISSCNNETKKDADTLSAKADSLFEEVMDGHNIGMAKEHKLSEMQQQIQRVLDSIGKLPSKTREAMAPYKMQLDSLTKELEYASFAMDKWMDDFKYDSAKNNLEQRIQYLADEKLKIGKVKEAILGSLKKADSLLKK